MTCLNLFWKRSGSYDAPVTRALIVAALAAVVVAGAILLSAGDGNGEMEATSAPPDAAREVARLYEGIPQDGVRLGSPDAPATLVEFADLQCPFCARYSTQVLPSVVQDYVRNGRIDYELRMRAFIGRDSVRAAGAAAVAAREDRLYQFADLFYREQEPENSGYVTNAFVRGIAARVSGLDVDRVVAAANDPLAQPLVHEAQELAERADSSGTPDFYLRRGDRGRLTRVRVSGFSQEDFTRALEAALGES
jgi:protein-disulfide isomerase